ncbi:hypothetical protein BT96DRAFT_1048226 [Gymnopus androsaceus JB14]|uniref:Transmembrane protein n=1 Tax=Gymnopus androsaceus JB14 TaxID=1447944 RepID=A0A6A4IDQ2_9AGAR|nr:hypothetical protein BT96DRAFT_1048226 [Gymnopus androsaceus JB14]
MAPSVFVFSLVDYCVFEVLIPCIIEVFLYGDSLSIPAGLGSSEFWLDPAPNYIFLLAGLLADIMLTHRCYRLWSSKKHVIILPVVGILATIAGRLWWLDYRIQKTMQLAGKPATNHTSQNLLGLILESSALTPLFLLTWMLLAFSPATKGTRWSILITPSILTEIVGIASTLIVVRIGLGVDTLASQSHSNPTSHADPENQNYGSELPVEPPTDDSLPMISIPVPPANMSNETIQPFSLKYQHHGQHSMENNVYTGSSSEDSGMQGEARSGLIQPFQLKYEQDQVENVSGCFDLPDNNLHAGIGDGVIQPFQLKYAMDQPLVQPPPCATYPNDGGQSKPKQTII